MIAARQIIIKNLAIIVLIFIIGAYLVAKALPENSWDGWGCCSAQTLLSNKHWVDSGFLNNYLLLIPQGYSKTVRYFDDPELRQHTRGIATGGLIGKRLYYTHYPSGYLLPSALLMKFGIEERFWLRMLEIFFSLGALAILYWIFTMISNRLIAFLGVLYYGVSVLFLDYADSLANQPIDELLRFAIIALSIFAINHRKKYFNFSIWVLYFGLALSSYDSTFFIFAWLIGIEWINNKKINWRNALLWVSAPILAFAVQILQNTLYLGWYDMLLDFYGAFKVQMVGSRSSFFVSHFKRLIEPFDWFFGVKWFLGIFLALGGIFSLKMIKKYFNLELVNIKYLTLGLMAILFNFLFFPSLFFYQARIISVFGGLLVAVLAVSLSKIIYEIKNKNFRFKFIFLIMLTVIISPWLIQANRTYVYAKKWPNNVWPMEKIEFDRKIKNLIPGDKVIFSLVSYNKEYPNPDRYPMANPEDEYYTGAPILGFTKAGDLIRDLIYLKKHSEFPFTAIIVSKEKEAIIAIREKLTKLQIQKMTPILNLEDQFVFVVSE